MRLNASCANDVLGLAVFQTAAKRNSGNHMQIHGHTIAVCSWSLQPTGMQDLVSKVKQLGLGHVQLALGELVFLDDKRKHQELGHLRSAGIQFIGGMLSFPGEDYSTIDAIRRTGRLV